DFERPDPSASSSYARVDDPGIPVPRDWNTTSGESPASIVQSEWSLLLEMRSEKRIAAERPHAPAPTPVKQIVREAVRPVVNEARLGVRPQVRLVSRETTEPVIPPLPSRIPSNVGASTRLVDFETAPFPYHGVVPGSGRPFLSAGDPSRRGHANF